MRNRASTNIDFQVIYSGSGHGTELCRNCEFGLVAGELAKCCVAGCEYNQAGRRFMDQERRNTDMKVRMLIPYGKFYQN